MASASSLVSAKHLKCLTKYDESELLVGISTLSKMGQETIKNVSQKLVSAMKTVNTTRVKVALKNRKRISKHELLSEALLKIESALSEYESRDQEEQWTIHFEVGVKYDDLCTDEIVRLHHDLLKSSLYMEQTRLIVYTERGRLYDNLKFSEKWQNKWRSLCKDMNVCANTANRYIDFYRIVNAYPRIIICGLNFETIMYLFTELSTYLSANENRSLALKLAQPLRNTLVKANIELNAEILPHGGEPPTRLMSENADWNAAWEMSDQIVTRQAKTLDDDDDDDDDDDNQQVASIEDDSLEYDDFNLNIDQMSLNKAKQI